VPTRLLLLALLVPAVACRPEPVSEPHGDPPALVVGRVVAGPTCPVVQDPPDPECADRPVAGAVIVVLDEEGREVTHATSDQRGAFTLELGPGAAYTLVPQPVEGLLGTAQPVEVASRDFGERVAVTIVYDTGIR
jgi:hypothetical protein